MPEKTQVSFGGGEMSPSLYGRTDLARYAVSAKAIENVIVHSTGGASNRAGFQYINTTKSNKLARLIPFIFNNDQAYVLEFTDFLMRVYRDGALLGGPYELVTPWPEALLKDLRFTQSNDVMTIVVDTATPRELVRITDTNWTLTPISFGVIKQPPASLTLTGGVTSSISTAITGISTANPGVLSAAGHTINNGDNFIIRNVSGMTEVNDKVYRAKNVVAGVSIELTDQFTGQNIDTTTFGTYTGPSGQVAENVGQFQYTYGVTAIDSTTFEESEVRSATSSLMTELSQTNVDAGQYNDLTWPVVSNTFRYNIYRSENGIFGYIGSTTSVNYRDRTVTPDFFNSPPEDVNIFIGASNQPLSVAYVQQRLAFGGTADEPQKIFLSETGHFHSFNTSFPVKDDNAVSFVMNARQVNKIEHLVPIDGGLLALTTGADWIINGGGGKNSPITPSSVVANLQEYRGSARPVPLTIGNSVLFVQNRGSFVRDLAFTFETEGYTGNDLSVFSNHYFSGHTILEWGYAEIPDSIIWAIRDDGVMLGLTYVKDQNIWAWHKHTTQGFFESVAVIPEGDEDAVYCAIKREVNGATVRYVERLHTRQFSSVRDAFFVDSGLTLDIPIAITNITQANPCVISASGHTLVNGDFADIDNVVGMTDVNLKQYKVAGVVAGVSFQLTDQYSGAPIDSIGFKAYENGGTVRKAVTAISGLAHLEGETVSILGNGDVIPEQVVSGGQITLPSPMSRVHVGLSYSKVLETLDLSLIELGTQRGKDKTINSVTVQQKDSRGLQIGPDANNLRPVKEREQEGWNEEIKLQNGDITIIIDPKWLKTGSVYMSMPDPLPMTILSVTPNATISS